MTVGRGCSPCSAPTRPRPRPRLGASSGCSRGDAAPRAGRGARTCFAMRIVRLTLDCADLGVQEEFWAGTLGLEVARERVDELEVRLRSSTIAFRRATPGTAPRYHFAINVPPGSIERAAA